MRNLRVLQGRIKKRSAKPVSKRQVDAGQWEGFDGEPIDSQHLLISTLLPPAVKMFFDELENDVAALCGNRYDRGRENHRWGSQSGSIVLGKQKFRIKKPRVRNRASKDEVELPVYERFQDPELFDEAVFQEGMKKVSQRDYEKGLPKIAASMGFTKSSVSRKWVKATA